MKLKTKISALTVALAMGVVALAGCKNNKGGNNPPAPPAPVTYYVTVNQGSWTVNGINEEGYYAGDNVSFTVAPGEEREIVSVVADRDIGTLTPDEGQYSFRMPENNVRVTVTDKAIKRYALSLSGELKVDAADVEASLVYGSDPITDFTLSTLEGGDNVSITGHTVHAVAAGNTTLVAFVNDQQVATLDVTVQASEIMAIKDALDAAIEEAPCNGKGGNNSKKTTSSYTIAGEIVYKSKWNEGTTSGFDLDVIIDDGTEATILIVHSNKSTLAEAEAQAEYEVGDSIKTTCKFTNYYGLLEGISTGSDDTHQYSLYPDNLIKIEKTYEQKYLQKAAMTGAQLDSYATTAAANQSASAHAYTDIKYVTLADVTFDEDRDMDGPDKDVEVGGFVLAGSQYAINAAEKSTIEIDQVDGHVSTLEGLLTGVNTNYKTTKMYAFSQTPKAVESITFADGASKTIFLNNPYQLEYTTSPEGSYGVEYWVSGNPDVLSITQDGVITGLLEGDSDVTLFIDGTVQQTISIHVSGEEHACESVELNKESISLVKGASETLVATITPENCTDPVSWSSDDETIATVDEEGKVTAASDKTGTATITITCGELSDTCEVTVRQQKIADLDSATMNDSVDVYGFVSGKYPVSTQYGLWIGDGNRGVYAHINSSSYSIGDLVHVTGTIECRYGGRQVKNAAVEKVTGDYGVSAVTSLEITDELIAGIATNAKYQGAKATITGQVTAHSGTGGSAHHTITVKVGTESLKVYVHKDYCGATVTADFDRAAVGTTVTITGFVTANKNNCSDFSQLAKGDYQLINPTLDNVVAPQATGFALNKSTVQIEQGDTFTLVASGTPAGSELPEDVSFEVTGGTAEEGMVTVDPETGVITVDADAVVGSTAIITASCGELADQTCTVTVIEKVIGTKDIIDNAFTGISGSTYTAWSGKTGASGAVYAGFTAGSNSTVQLRSKNSNEGIISTTSGGKIAKVIIVWNSATVADRTVNIYGSNTAYTAVTDLYDASKQGTLLGTIVKDTSTELTVTGNYAYIGIRSAKDAMYIDSITVVWLDE